MTGATWRSTPTPPAWWPATPTGVRDVFVYDRANGTVERISVGAGGKQANGDSQRPTLSADGRLVAFWSAADNLVEGDTNKVTDCFVHDRQSHETIRVDLGPDDVQANGECARPVISGDGKLVAFESAATNLEKPNVLGKSTDTNKARDVFVRDLEGKHDDPGQPDDRREAGGGRQRPAGDLGRRPLRRLPVRARPAGRRHQQEERRLPPRPRDQGDHPDQHRSGRRGGERRELQPHDERRRASHRLLVERHQPRPR